MDQNYVPKMACPAKWNQAVKTCGPYPGGLILTNTHFCGVNTATLETHSLGNSPTRLDCASSLGSLQQRAPWSCRTWRLRRESRTGGREGREGREGRGGKGEKGGKGGKGGEGGEGREGRAGREEADMESQSWARGPM